MKNYYALAIRNNIGNLYAMKKEILSILFHFTNLPDNFDCHKFCPRDAGSWCKYWSNENKSYRSLNSIPMWIKNLIFPTFKALIEDELLEKCMHGKTQNANEALNTIIWSRVPKYTLSFPLPDKGVLVFLYDFTRFCANESQGASVRDQYTRA